MTQGASPPETADRLHSAAIHLLRRVRRHDAKLGVGPAALSALSVLVFGGPRTAGELAAIEQVTAPTMSRIVAGLEHQGLARRVADPADGRRQILRATAAGRAVMQRGRRRRVAEIAALLAALPTGEVTALAHAAELIERLARTRIPAAPRSPSAIP